MLFIEEIVPVIGEAKSNVEIMWHENSNPINN